MVNKIKVEHGKANWTLMCLINKTLFKITKHKSGLGNVLQYHGTVNILLIKLGISNWIF